MILPLFSIPLPWWIAGGFAVLTIWVFEASFSLQKRTLKQMDTLETESADLRDRLTPKFQLSFHPEAEGLARTPIYQQRITPFSQQQLAMAEYEAIYIRIRVEAITAITGLRAFLTKLEKQNGHFSEIALPHGIGLRADQPFDVHPSVICPVDFAVCSSEDNKMQVPQSSWPLALRSAFDEAGTYRFTITVSAQGVSEAITALVDWPGQWDKVTARSL